MAISKKKSTVVRVLKPIASNLHEIGRFLEVESGEEIERPRTAALEMLVREFLYEHRQHFSRKEPAEEGELPHFVYRGEASSSDSDEKAVSDDEKGKQDTEAHLSFSLQDGPSRSA
jgi:hypothetical protein